MVEVRNGSGQSKQQWVFGTQYTDEIVLMDNNGASDGDNDCDPGVTLMEEVAEPGDQRFFYHQDRNWNVVALTTMATADELYSDGEVVERYAYSPYGEPTVIAITPPLGGSAAAGSGNVRGASLVGNVFLHQGLPLDREKGSYQNRWRVRFPQTGRFAVADPSNYSDGLNRYLYLRGKIPNRVDPLGLKSTSPQQACQQANWEPQGGEFGRPAAQTVCDGNGGFVMCIACQNGQQGCYIARTPPSSGQASLGCTDFLQCNCAMLVEYCLCHAEASHVDRFRAHRPTACVGRGPGTPPAYGSNSACYQAWTEMEAGREMLSCMEANSGICPAGVTAQVRNVVQARESQYYENCEGFTP